MKIIYLRNIIEKPGKLKGFSNMIIFRITSNSLNSTASLTEPEKVLEMNGHVIGMNISPNNNYLYVNVRSWPENAVPSIDQPPPINQNIELRTIDLRTLEIQPQVRKISNNT